MLKLVKNRFYGKTVVYPKKRKKLNVVCDHKIFDYVDVLYRSKHAIFFEIGIGPNRLKRSYFYSFYNEDTRCLEIQITPSEFSPCHDSDRKAPAQFHTISISPLPFKSSEVTILDDGDMASKYTIRIAVFDAKLPRELHWWAEG